MSPFEQWNQPRIFTELSDISVLPLEGELGEDLNECILGRFQEPDKGSSRVKPWIGVGLGNYLNSDS